MSPQTPATTPATVHCAVYDGLADWEVGYATAHVNTPEWQRDPGRYRVATVAETPDPITTMGGARIVPEVVLADLDPAASAMLILPGADSWMAGGNGAFVEAARRCLDAGTPVAAICGATVGLAVGGLLDDRRHTSNHIAPLQGVGYGGAEHYVDAPAVTDGDLITASGTAPAAFAHEVFARLGLYRPEVLAAWTKLYADGDPQGYFELMEATG